MPQSSANSVGSVSLIHALCSAMPPPGYNKERPHCFVLTLPSGGSYFFQAGTPDLVTEWVSTCNYWSARLSKEPLSGGVSNMEYGWNRADASSRSSLEQHDDTMSVRSGRSKRSYQISLAQSTSGASHASGGNDRIVIAEWTPPAVPTGASQLSEDAQLENLKRHIGIVRDELTQHNALRAPMQRLVRLFWFVCNDHRAHLTHWDETVLASQRQRFKSEQQLGAQVQVLAGRDRQVPDVH